MRRFAEHIATKGLQKGDERPAVMVVSHKARRTLFAIDRLRSVPKCLGGAGERQPGLLKQVKSRCRRDGDFGLPRNSVQLAVAAAFGGQCTF